MERPTWQMLQPPARVKLVRLADAAMRLRPKKGDFFKWPLRKTPRKIPGALVNIRQLAKRPVLIEPFWHSQFLMSRKCMSVIAVHTAKTAHIDVQRRDLLQ
jgi:hypothetical protein